MSTALESTQSQTQKQASVGQAFPGQDGKRGQETLEFVSQLVRHTQAQTVRGPASNQVKGEATTKGCLPVRKGGIWNRYVY